MICMCSACAAGGAVPGIPQRIPFFALQCAAIRGEERRKTVNTTQASNAMHLSATAPVLDSHALVLSCALNLDKRPAASEGSITYPNHHLRSLTWWAERLVLSQLTRNSSRRFILIHSLRVPRSAPSLDFYGAIH